MKNDYGVSIHGCEDFEQWEPPEGITKGDFVRSALLIMSTIRSESMAGLEVIGGRLAGCAGLFGFDTELTFDMMDVLAWFQEGNETIEGRLQLTSEQYDAMDKVARELRRMLDAAEIEE